MNKLFSKRNSLILAFIFSFSIIVVRVLTVPMNDAKKSRDAIHGDAYSDINTYSAVLFFNDFGFEKSCYLPVHNYKGNKKIKNVVVYTHYPALPDILAGAYSKIFHSVDERVLRIFPVLISVVFFFFVFYFFKILLPDQNAAFASAMLIVLSNYFIFWGDNLHKHLYEEFFKWLYVFFLFLYYRDGDKNKWLILLCAFIFVLVTNVSFEPVTYLAVVTVGMSWIYKRKIFSWENVFLGAAPVIGFALHFYQNILHFGSFDVALADMTSSATMRTVGDAASNQNEMKRTLGILDYLDVPFMWLRRIERYFLIAGPAFVYLAYLGLKEIKKENSKLFQLGIVLIIATLSWNIAMTQHSIVHSFTTRHIGIFFGFAGGYGLLKYFEIFKTDWKGELLYKKVLHVGFILYIAVMMVSQQLFDYLRYGYLYTFLN